MNGLMQIRFGGFLGRRPSGRRSISAGCNAVSPRQDVDGPDQIGIRAEPTRDAPKLRLGVPVGPCCVAACGTCPAGILRRHDEEDAAVPRQLVVQLTAELEPPLIEDRAVQARLGPNHSARIFNSSRGRLGHIPHLQVLDTYHRVVFADGGRDLVQVVAAAVADAGMNLLHLAAKHSGLGGCDGIEPSRRRAIHLRPEGQSFPRTLVKKPGGTLVRPAGDRLGAPPRRYSVMWRQAADCHDLPRQSLTRHRAHIEAKCSFLVYPCCLAWPPYYQGVMPSHASLC